LPQSLRFGSSSSSKLTLKITIIIIVQCSRLFMLARPPNLFEFDHSLSTRRLRTKPLQNPPATHPGQHPSHLILHSTSPTLRRHWQITLSLRPQSPIPLLLTSAQFEHALESLPHQPISRSGPHPVSLVASAFEPPVPPINHHLRHSISLNPSARADLVRIATAAIPPPASPQNSTLRPLLLRVATICA
jgi:hypothetical protein